MTNTPLTEASIINEMGRSGWVGERAAYYLSDEAMDELVAAAGLGSHAKRADFVKIMNHVVANFCLGLTRYDDKKSAQKITTVLAQKAKNIAQAAEDLLAHIETLTDDEIHWLFGYVFEHSDTNVVPTFEQWLQYTRAFQHYAKLSPIEVKRSTPPVMRDFVVRCIHILEHFTGKPIIRRRVAEEGADSQMINDFMVTLLHHFPEALKAKLPQSVTSLNGVIREAIELVRGAEQQAEKDLQQAEENRKKYTR